MDKISEYLGHTRIDITKNVYAKYQPGHLEDAAEALEVCRMRYLPDHTKKLSNNLRVGQSSQGQFPVHVVRTVTSFRCQDSAPLFIEQQGACKRVSSRPASTVYCGVWAKDPQHVVW